MFSQHVAVQHGQQRKMSSGVVLATSSATYQVSRKRSIVTSATIIPKEAKKVKHVMSVLPARLLKPGKNPIVKPQDHLNQLLKERGVCTNVHSFNSEKVKHLFVEPTEKEIEAYGFEVLEVIRKRDIPGLKALREKGTPLKCSNRFGESLLHLACRKGFADVTDFLINEAEVPLWVKDDFGRTPLIDACWTVEPNFELIDLILTKDPDLLYVTDARGHTPLMYIRSTHWEEWIKYIDNNIDKMLPRNLNKAEEDGETAILKR